MGAMTSCPWTRFGLEDIMEDILASCTGAIAAPARRMPATSFAEYTMTLSFGKLFTYY